MNLIAKVENGSVKIYNAANGSYQRTICSDAVSAVVSGDTVAVTMINGQVKIYNVINGSYQRTI